jgi:hypothetical protein
MCDVNGDNFDDLMFVALASDTINSKVTIIFGGPNTPSLSPLNATNIPSSQGFYITG